ncbi:MAG TPA: hypothetical protein ENL06_03880, partial [Candidatus Portnoybacteria bacterium]|nr:hypothetical protein [Candidatus Portnoybacteria bacterium]
MFKKNLFNFLGIILGLCFLLVGVAVAKFGRPINFLGFISRTDNNYYLSSESTSSSSLHLNHSTKSFHQDKSLNVHSKTQGINNKNVEQGLQNISSNLDQLIDGAEEVVNMTSTKNENTGEYTKKGKNKEQKNNLIKSESKNELSSTTKKISKDLLTSKTTSKNISSSSKHLFSRHQNILNQSQKIEKTTSQKIQGIGTQKTKETESQEINRLNNKAYKINQNISEAKNQINKTIEKKKMMSEATELLNVKNNFSNSNNNERKNSADRGNIQGINKIIKQTKVSQSAPVVKKLENSAKVARNLAQEAKKIVSASKNLPNKQKKKIISLSTQIERKARIVNLVAKEMENKTTINLAKDSDGDGISDFAEITIYHTNPNNSDTDKDGLSDGDEIKSGLNPLKSSDDNIIQNIKKE